MKQLTLSLLTVGTVLLISPWVLAVNPTNAPNTVIIPGSRFGDIQAKTTFADLVKLYGAKNVVKSEWYVAEGMCQPGVKLFPNQPTKEAQLIWGDKKHQAFPLSIQLMGDKSIWKTSQGISLGSTAADLARINQAPFKLSGFGWDYGGYVHSFGKGTLSKVNMTVQLTLNADVPKLNGEQEISSTSLKSYATKAKVNRLVFGFNDNEKKFKNNDTQEPCKN